VLTPTTPNCSASPTRQARRRSGAGTAAGLKVVYGVWMFSVVLLWDMLVAIFIGNRVVLRSFSNVLPALERISGVILIGLALSVIAVNVLQLSR